VGVVHAHIHPLITQEKIAFSTVGTRFFALAKVPDYGRVCPVLRLECLRLRRNERPAKHCRGWLWRHLLLPSHGLLGRHMTQPKELRWPSGSAPQSDAAMPEAFSATRCVVPERAARLARRRRAAARTCRHLLDLLDRRQRIAPCDFRDRLRVGRRGYDWP
jgi:hypothetical protein